jgi:hypothetical protein
MIERYSAAERIDAPVDRIWGLLSDFGNRDVVQGFCRSVHVEGRGAGALRTFELFEETGGGAVSERIEEFDAPAYYFRYRVIDIGPLPFVDYVGSIRLALAGPERCVVIYHAEFLPVGGFPPGLGLQMTQQNFQFLVARLRELSSK